MVKAVVGEEAQLKLVEDRLSRAALPAEVGLAIGKLSSSLDREFVLDLIPTPLNDSNEPACAIIDTSKDDKRKGPKSKSQSTDSSSLFIDMDWVAEHARQVSRMLVGGIKVVGIYIWVSENAFKNSTGVLCQTVKGVAEAASSLETDWDERLLVHVCYSPRRWNCRSCSLSPNITSSSLRPCDFKMGKVLNSLQMFRCMYNFNLRLPIFHENASKFQTVNDVLRHAISIHAKELKGAEALIDGKLVDDNEHCSSDSVHEVEMLLPFMSNSPVEACSRRDVLGILYFSGSICSFAYLNSKEPLSQAITDVKEVLLRPFAYLYLYLIGQIWIQMAKDSPSRGQQLLKGDIITSLQSRLDIICDEAECDSSSNIDDSREASDEISTEKPVAKLVLQLLRKECSLPLPRRVFAPWLAGIYVCDYLQPTDTVEVLRDHCTELLSVKSPAADPTILEPEKEASAIVSKSFWEVAVPFGLAIPHVEEKGRIEDRGERSSKSLKPFNINVLATGLVLVLAIMLGFALLVLKG